MALKTVDLSGFSKTKSFLIKKMSFREEKKSNNIIESQGFLIVLLSLLYFFYMQKESRIIDYILISQQYDKLWFFPFYVGTMKIKQNYNENGAKLKWTRDQYMK